MIKINILNGLYGIVADRIEIVRAAFTCYERGYPDLIALLRNS
ncbi:hypothetical protein [Ferruginibacter lapsinanis]|nr:hypothetical protein [Ferruginibacter lapsinanis]